MRVHFVWQGVSDPNVLGHWNDGLCSAMNIIAQTHDVSFREPWDDLSDADLILYWEAPCTLNGPNAQHYKKVMETPIRKALLFAGGPIKPEWVKGFDMVFTESQINDDEFAELGIPFIRAFGINSGIFEPLHLKKEYDAVHHGTFASWKRQWLLAQALGEKALIFGARQATDTRPWDDSEKFGATLMEKQSYVATNYLINQAHCLVNCADFWGGGQRTTLEAMSAGLPVIVMSDSPKNIEYVEASGAGIIVKPEPDRIKEAVQEIKKWTINDIMRGREYVLNNWTPRHYANSLLSWINN